MQFDLKLDHQTRAVAMATAGAAVAAVAAMMMPVGIWEMVTGATGLSELVPATGAPLGDTARALIAFGFGSLAFAILATLLLRRPSPQRAILPEIADYSEEPAAIIYETADPLEDGAEQPSALARIKQRLSGFVAARRGDDDISALEDLPKLRSGDAHPDAPPRRPLLATRDLPDPVPAAEPVSAVEDEECVENSAPHVAFEVMADEVADVLPESAVEPVAVATQDDSVAAPVDAVEPEPVGSDLPQPASAPADATIASLAEMVGRLEQALAEREQALAQLQALASEQVALPAGLREVPAAAGAEAPVEEAVVSRPVEITPAPIASEAEEMDAALRSALDTLYRMNARSR